MTAPSKERIEEIREVRSKTPDSDPWEAGAVSDLLAYIDALESELELLKNPSDGRCMEIAALRNRAKELEAENEKLKLGNFHEINKISNSAYER